MIYLNEATRNAIARLDRDKMYVVADFDRTLTECSSRGSWGILEESDFISPEYTEESLFLYNHFYPLEYNNDIPIETRSELMQDWWTQVVMLFMKYGLEEEAVENATHNLETIRFRKGGREFLRDMYERDVPVVIISAGIGNFIEQFLRYHNCWFDNIHLISNFIKFENGVAAGVKGTIIHTFNKNIVALGDAVLAKLAGREQILLLGDNLADVQMVPDSKRDKTIRVGFLDYEIDENMEKFQETYDVVCSDNTSFHELAQLLGWDLR